MAIVRITSLSPPMMPLLRPGRWLSCWGVLEDARATSPPSYLNETTDAGLRPPHRSTATTTASA